jgi:hypothetical protein
MRKHNTVVGTSENRKRCLTIGLDLGEIGTHSPWVSRYLADLGHEVIVAMHAGCG